MSSADDEANTDDAYAADQNAHDTGDAPPVTEGLRPSTTEELHPDRQEGVFYLKLIGLGAAIGIPAALLAWAFLGAVHWLEELLWTDLPEHLGLGEPPWYLVIGLPLVGAILVALATALLPGNGGHSPLDGVGVTPTPWQHAPGIALAAVGTLAFGAVLGPEAPLIALGSAVGMLVVPFAKVPEAGQRVLATAGSFSAVSALFGGPLVAGLLLLEAGLAAGAALLPALLPGLVAAAIGYIVFIGLGDWGGLGVMTLAVPEMPDYVGTRVIDLLLAIVVGVVVALLMFQVKKAAELIDRVASADRMRRYGLLLAGGLAVGLLALAARALGADTDDILFSGQTAVPLVLAETSVGALVVILVFKAVAYAICLGCGFRGGPVFPAIFIGVALASVGCLVFDCSITWALAVGAAAGMTAGTGFVFSSLLFSMLLTGTVGLDAVPAAVLGVIAAWLTTAALSRRRDTGGSLAESVS
ncbi:chloride channel protein [Gordonia sp. PKS22-38]|uniref:Chloride channel protein n=1 Tax=Gordonia prachuapensis TaxID=3115651 RepID=A0ABU7MP91_9ACTN|nr:chloride channel protein [Gordonia sp. PKS22-38]